MIRHQRIMWQIVMHRGFAKRYKQDGLQGGHVILFESTVLPYYEKTKKQALEALHAYEGGLQAGGGITQIMHLIFCVQVHLM